MSLLQLLPTQQRPWRSGEWTIPASWLQFSLTSSEQWAKIGQQLRELEVLPTGIATSSWQTQPEKSQSIMALTVCSLLQRQWTSIQVEQSTVLSSSNPIACSQDSTTSRGRTNSYSVCKKAVGWSKTWHTRSDIFYFFFTTSDTFQRRYRLY